jgi:flavin reductase (DIM6/NTAB) family NADH-FMN oxidoreductase RutF
MQVGLVDLLSREGAKLQGCEMVTASEKKKPELTATLANLGVVGLRGEFIDAMAANSTSVNVVSTANERGPMGVTVSASNSVSADPPTLLVCINTRSPACLAVEASGVFAVNLLSAGQRHIADTFAGRAAKGKPFDFACCDWVPGVLGVPLIKGAVASLECRVVGQKTVGTHRVFFGEVVAVERAEHTPLLYCRRDYGRFEPL